MYKRNNKRGFTMAEMLIAVAIIGVLAAVSFVAVAQHQRSLERVERDSVAREIFIAAQNHLTMAQSQGYLGLEGGIYGNAEDGGAGIYYFVVNQGDQYSPDAAPRTLLDLMLPNGSLDEVVRTGGNYIIRYHPESATVMDVFYCSSDSRFGYTFSGTKEEEKELCDNWREGKESKRKNYNGKVLGWYGGATAETLSKVELYAPLIVVENADRLRVGIKNGKGEEGESNPDSSELQLIVTGNTSKYQMVFALKPATSNSRVSVNEEPVTIEGLECDYTVVLDDITVAGMHFADLAGFIPGEDITVQAVAFDNSQISNVAYSAAITVNSLYEKLDVDTENNSMTASVSSIRHLENLDPQISNVADTRDFGEGEGAVQCTLNKAVQTSDLDWIHFQENTKPSDEDDTPEGGIFLYGDLTGSTDPGCYMPVTPTHDLSYDGQNHSITDIKVDIVGDAGLFGAVKGAGDEFVTPNPRIANLTLIDFSIAQSEEADEGTHAGALAGTLENVVVENVIAYSSKTGCGVTAKEGSAGGLIGSATYCDIAKSAASLYVTSDKGDAGGLIGNIRGSEVSACYSGGHTHDGTYYNDEGTAVYNITATSGNAGGLIGTAVNTPIKYSYSTCSATGATAGGFVATTTASVTGVAISHCYATGLVQGTGEDEIDEKMVPKDGAFAYSAAAGVTITDCRYFEIINERPDANHGCTYLTALGQNGTNTEIKPLDADTVDDPDLETYNSFVTVDGKPASAYDPSLVEYYGGKYPLRTVEQLSTSLKTGDDDTTVYYVATHHGDWPAPEIFVFNTATTPGP